MKVTGYKVYKCLTDNKGNIVHKTPVGCAKTEKGTSLHEVLEDTPTADVVAVVRCKDCKYYQDNNGGYPHEECRWCMDETPNADDYCSYGARKDEE